MYSLRPKWAEPLSRELWEHLVKTQGKRPSKSRLIADVKLQEAERVKRDRVAPICYQCWKALQVIREKVAK